VLEAFSVALAELISPVKAAKNHLGGDFFIFLFFYYSDKA